MRIAFIGVGYFPTRTAGEKNFYLKLLPLIRERADDVIVLSVNDQDQEVFTQETEGGSIPIYNFKRPFHWGDKKRFLKIINGVHCYHHRHGPAQEMLEKFLTLSVNMGRIRKIINKHQIDVIYFMDNFGFGMEYTRKRLSKKTVFAAANYDPRGRFYDQLQAYFIRGLDLIVTYSHAYKTILSSIGIKNDRIVVIHWGVDPETLKPLEKQVREQARVRHGIKNGNSVILWTGYIQQIQEKDFYLAISVAKTIRKRRPDIQFVFCFKPETYRPVYKDEEADGIQVISGAPNFHELLGSADILFSPTHKLSSTVSPPLTWVEAMSMGVPVITTKVKGAEEIIEHMSTGYISDDYDMIAEDIMTIIDAGIDDDMKSNARKKVTADYNIQHIADSFAAEFGEMT
jgi:glycosyltransferase involved in cell wall biosynthesis